MRTIGEHRGPFKGIVRHRETEKYYMGNGEWTTDVEQAMEFESLLQLAEEAQQYNIRDCCEFILKFSGEANFAVFLPL